jgi:hypothetical protein
VFQGLHPGAGFMPGGWAKIESRQRYSILLRRLTGAFVTTAAVLCLMMSLYIARTPQSPADLTTYVETLDEDDFYHTVAYLGTSVVEAPQGFTVE